MADVSDERINQGRPCSFTSDIHGLNQHRDPPAYLDVRSDKSDTNWLLLDYEVRATLFAVTVMCP